jgi:hypothetical protein
VQIPNFIRWLGLAAWLLVLWPGVAAEPTPAPSKRVALVIGNGRYEPSVGPLRNTVNDAKAMTKALRSLGFTVIEAQNVTRDELMAAVLKFRGQLRGAEVGLFYFAGHGISVAGANYLLPVKSGYAPEALADADRRLLAETRLFNAEQVVAEMVNSGVRCNLLILDACRTTAVARNPAIRDAVKAGGLVEMNPPAGSLIAFATDAGRAASDGEGTNGLYTSELITHLLTPGLTIEQVFKRTRKGVMERSNGAQLPAEYSRLVGDDIFLAGRMVKVDEESIPRGEPVRVPTLAEINKLAARGDTVACLEALRRSARQQGTLDAAGPLAVLLDQIKETLRAPKLSAAQAGAILQSCEQILAAIEVLLPESHAQHAVLTAQAQNRRGDALLLLGRPEDALAAFNAALALTPEDAYVLYNRGSALLALNRLEEARADFTTVAGPATKQPGARKLAAAALAKMK